MGIVYCNLKNTVAAFVAIVMFSLPVGAGGDSRLNRLFGELKEAEPADARRIADEIQLELSKSGSASMDMLLKRGLDALEVGDLALAVEHLTALVDHAPNFAEAWHMRSVAYARSGLLGPAMSDLERSLALRPRNFAAIYSLGALLEQLDKPELAYAAYEQVLAIHPYFEDVTAALERVGAQIGGAKL